MVEIIHNEKLLIHYFPKSLSRAIVKWFIQLDSKIKRWKDLMDTLLKKYKFNINIAPDQSNLMAMDKKSTKIIKEYTERWREVVSQINLPLTDKELITIFIYTFKVPYIERMIKKIFQLILLIWLL